MKDNNNSLAVPNLTIPPEAVEAAAVMLSNGKTTAQAIAAALEAWPGMQGKSKARVDDFETGELSWHYSIILPLPQESPDADA